MIQNHFSLFLIIEKRPIANALRFDNEYLLYTHIVRTNVLVQKTTHSLNWKWKRMNLDFDTL